MHCKGSGVNRRFLGEEQVGSVKGQIAINFIGRYLMIADNAIFMASIHHHLSAKDIRLEEHFEIFDRTVSMALRRKVHHDIGMFILENLVDCLTITNVALEENLKLEFFMASASVDILPA